MESEKNTGLYSLEKNCFPYTLFWLNYFNYFNYFKFFFGFPVKTWYYYIFQKDQNLWDEVAQFLLKSVNVMRIWHNSISKHFIVICVNKNILMLTQITFLAINIRLH